jgi:hypothetical protein
MIDLARLSEPQMRRRLADAVYAADELAGRGPNDGEQEELDDAALAPYKQRTISELITAGVNPTTATTAVSTGDWTILWNQLPAANTSDNTNGLMISTGDSRTTAGQTQEHSGSDPLLSDSEAGQHSTVPTDLKSRIRARLAEQGKIIDKIEAEGIRL